MHPEFCTPSCALFSGRNISVVLRGLPDHEAVRLDRPLQLVGCSRGWTTLHRLSELVISRDIIRKYWRAVGLEQKWNTLPILLLELGLRPLLGLKLVLECADPLEASLG